MTKAAQECLVDGCDHLTFSERFCSVHNLDHRAHREFTRRELSPLCKIDGCDRRVAIQKQGLCEKHNAQHKRKKNPRCAEDKVCLNCHKLFTPSSTADHIKFCSPLCRSRAGSIRHVYKIEVTQIWDMLVTQDFKCQICSSKIDRNSACIDHDHKCCPTDPKARHQRSCGKCVRGLLCKRCNWGLGHFSDNTNTLRSAISYLEAWEE